MMKREDVEFDHIKRWIEGEKTEVLNGKVVHKSCHARGRSVAEFNQ